MSIRKAKSELRGLQRGTKSQRDATHSINAWQTKCKMHFYCILKQIEKPTFCCRSKKVGKCCRASKCNTT